MSWTYNGVRIFVTGIEDEHKQIIARLQPINAGTVKQIFGYETPVYRVNGLVVGETDHAALAGYKDDGTAYTLISPEGSLGSFLLANIKFTRVQCICQTLRPDLPSDSPVYSFTMELYV